MKKNTFYIICGLFAISLLFLFWLSILLSNPVIIAVSFLIEAVLLFVLKRRITDIVQDERSILIEMKTASATIKTAAVLLVTVNLGMVVYVFSDSLGFHTLTYNRSLNPMLFPEGYASVPYFPVPPETIPISVLGLFAVMQIVLLVIVLFIYIGFQFYYAHKFGEWDDDEE